MQFESDEWQDGWFDINKYVDNIKEEEEVYDDE